LLVESIKIADKIQLFKRRIAALGSTKNTAASATLPVASPISAPTPVVVATRNITPTVAKPKTPKTHHKMQSLDSSPDVSGLDICDTAMTH
jgi:hypothetical protein